MNVIFTFQVLEIKDEYNGIKGCKGNEIFFSLKEEIRCLKGN